MFLQHHSLSYSVRKSALIIIFEKYYAVTFYVMFNVVDL